MYYSFTFISFLFSVYFISVHGSFIKDVVDTSYSIWDPYNSEDATLQLNTVDFSTYNGYTTALGDFNSDRHVDVFVVGQYSKNQTQQSLQVFLYSDDQYLLSSTQIISEGIENVIPCDFNMDGNLDILIQAKRGSKSTTTVYFGDRQQFSSTKELSIPSDVRYHLLLMDYNMDMVPDLFGVNGNTGERGFWVNDKTGSFTFTPFSGNQSSLNDISIPHSNAFVDMNGDCLPDLVIFSTDHTQKYMEIWLLTGTGVTLDKMIPLPIGAGQVSFSDINRDGTIDFIFPICIPSIVCTEVNTIEIVYNVQEELCTSITGSGDNCTADVCGVIHDYTIPNTITDVSTSDVIIIDKSQFNGYTFFWQAPFTGDAPNTLQIGDYNADGYPDILIVLQSELNDTQTQLWDNVECSSSLCNSPALDANRRTFSRSPNSPIIEGVNNTWASTFFDFSDDGTLDMMLLTYPPMDNPEQGFSIVSFKNWQIYGTFFVKATGLSGLCMDWCGNSDSPKFPDPEPIGVNQPGVIIKYIWSDNDQNKRVTIGTQLSQSGYFSLQSPYVYFGIGETSNYIQDIYFGFPNLLNERGKHFQYFPDITPNSQVIGIPSPPDKPYFWTIEKFVRPSGMTFWTIIACITTCIALALTALFFSFRERKKDAKEAEEKGHVLTL